jgi:hypothetical protein
MAVCAELATAVVLRTMPTSQNRDMGHPLLWLRVQGRARHAGQFQRLLFRFVLFEELPGFFEVESVAVDEELVFAGVFRDGDDAVDTMAVLPEGLDDEIGVYHG